MPLQGLEQATKDDLLRRVVQRQLSLKELRKAAESIKKKKKIISAFLKYTGEENWESLQKRFPQHATEEKLAQFKGVPLRRNKASPVSAMILSHDINLCNISCTSSEKVIAEIVKKCLYFEYLKAVISRQFIQMYSSFPLFLKIPNI